MALAAVQDGSQGVSAAMLTSASQIGSACAVPGLVTVASAQTAALAARPAVDAQLGGMQLGLWVNAGVALAAAAVALRALPPART